MSVFARYEDWEVAGPACQRTDGRIVGLSACGRPERVRPAAEIPYLPPRTLNRASRLPYAFRVEPTTPVKKRVEMLRRLAAQDADDPKLKAIAARLVSESDGTTRDIAQRILDWQAANIAYVQDPGTLEIFQSPRYLLEAQKGDCDKKSTLFVALAAGAGLLAESCWISQPKHRNNHVAARVCLGWRNGRPVPWRPEPWDYDQQGDPWALEVTCPDVAVDGCDMVWAEATLRGARIGEHPYDVLQRVRRERKERAVL